MHAQIRVRNITSKADITRTQIHNNREHDKHGFETPKNVVPGLEEKRGTRNAFTIGEEGETSLNKAIEDRFKEVGVKPHKDAVIALEYVVSFSKSLMEQIGKSRKEGGWNYSMHTALGKQIDFIVKKHGFENVISKALHFDESNPHAHIVVVPLVQKKTKWQQRREEKKGVEEITPFRLCARDFTGGPAKLSKLQDDFYNHCNDWTKQRFRFELTKHQKATLGMEYAPKTDHRLGLIRDDLKALNLEIAELSNNLDNVTEIALKELQKRKEDLVLKLDAEKSKPSELNKLDLKDIKFHQNNKIESSKPLIPKSPKRDQGLSM